MISCSQLKPWVKCFSNLFKKVFKLKKLVIDPKTTQSVELNEEPVDRKLNQSRSGLTPNSIGRGLGRSPAQPVEGVKNFFFLLERLFNRSRLNLNQLRSGRGSIEVRLRTDQGPTVTYQALNANGQSTERPPAQSIKPPTASLDFFPL